MLADYRVIGVEPDIDLDTFDRILREAQSPALSSAHAVWNYCKRRGVSPAFLLAMFKIESKFGTQGTATQTRSWGNTRLPNFGGVPDMGTVPGRSGVFPVFANWADGGISTASRFLDHAPYHGKTTVREIIPIWAPPTDQNDTEAYIAAVLASIESWVGQGTGGVSMTQAAQPPLDISHPSPNRNGYAKTRRVEAVIWHITQGKDSLGWLCNPASGASANFLIARTGTIYQLVPPTDDAWANGRVCEPDADHNQPLVTKWVKEGVNFNQRTVSVEHEGFTSSGAGGSLTKAQIASTVRLTAWLCQEFRLPPDRQHIFGHFEIDSCDRPNCPGFSEAEWQSWVGQVAALVGGTTPNEGGEVKEPQAGTFQTYINAAGETITAINYGGQAKAIQGTNIVDVGVSVTGTDDATYDRSVQANVVKEWTKR